MDNKIYLLQDYDILLSLFLLTVVAFDDALLLIEHMKEGGHGLVVGDAFGVGTFYNSQQLLGHIYLPLFYHLIVFDDVEADVWSYQRDAVDLIVVKELIGYLDDAFFAEFFTLEVVTDGYLAVYLIYTEQRDHSKEFVSRDVVNHGAVFESGNE